MKTFTLPGTNIVAPNIVLGMMRIGEKSDDEVRALVRAAVRVRLGRDRAVEVPRLPDRRDEIGLLARALSDMTGALRQRIDAVETFAADVAHEFKNPLASLRSAPESRAFYDRKRSEGKKHTQALIALARRRVNVLWAMLRDGTTFEGRSRA